MPIVPSATATIGRQARVLVSPFPATLSESSAILRALQSFGVVSTFLNSRYVSALKQEQQGDAFLAIFAEERAFEKAVQSSPFPVDVGHDEIDPAVEDPFMVRDLAGRKTLARKTFNCQIVADSDPHVHTRIVQSSPYYASFVVDRMAASYRDLLKQGVPLPEMADLFQQRQVGLGLHEDDSNRRKAIGSVTRPKHESGLMDLWREAIADENHVSGQKLNEDPAKKQAWRKLPPAVRRRLRQARKR